MLNLDAEQLSTILVPTPKRWLGDTLPYGGGKGGRLLKMFDFHTLLYMGGKGGKTEKSIIQASIILKFVSKTIRNIFFNEFFWTFIIIPDMSLHMEFCMCKTARDLDSCLLYHLFGFMVPPLGTVLPCLQLDHCTVGGG